MTHRGNSTSLPHASSTGAMHILRTFFIAAALLFVLGSLAFFLQGREVTWIMWRDEPVLAGTLILLGCLMAAGWFLTARITRREKEEEDAPRWRGRVRAAREDNPYNIWKKMEAPGRRRLAVAVFLTFAALGPLAMLIAGLSTPLHPLAVVLTTVGSGGFAASIILFGNRPFLLVTAMAFCIILSHYGNEISERTQGKQSSDRKEESAVREAASDRNGGTQSERMTLGFIAVAAIGLGYASFVYMLAKEGRQRARLESEVAVARKIQQTLLPGEGMKTSWYEAAGDTVPATEVGGDFFDYLELSGERLAIVVADVAGHGVGAGILSAMTKSAFRAEVMHDPSPSTVLRHLNAILYDLTERKMFVTMAYVLVDRRTATARIATAGHPPVLRWRSGNGVGWPSVALSPPGGRSAAFAEFRTPNLALGMRHDTEFSEETVPVRPGDMFIMYTDGVIEGLSPHGEQFGAQRLGDAIEDQGSGSATTITRQVVSRFLAFTGSAEERDDATLAVAKVTDGG